MNWLGKLLFPRANRHDREVRMGSLWLLVGLVMIGAVVAVLLYLARQQGR